MSFESLTEQLSEVHYNSLMYGDYFVRGSEFWTDEHEKQDYERKGESAKVVKARTSSSPEDKLRDKVKAELRLGWMCGMERDRRVQYECRNYSEIVRNNNILKKITHERIKHVKESLEDK